jgi:hypothetical protein
MGIVVGMELRMMAISHGDNYDHDNIIRARVLLGDVSLHGHAGIAIPFMFS